MLAMMPDRISFDNVDEILERFFVSVGFTENMDQSIDSIGSALGKKPVRAPLSNVTQVYEETDADYPSCRERDEEQFPLEYRLYESARSLFWT